MKIAYNNAGDITSVARDDQQIAGDHVVRVRDNIDVFTVPAKYRMMGPRAVRKAYLIATPESAEATVGSPITVRVQAYTGSETADPSATCLVNVQHMEGQCTPESFNLVAGAGSFTIASDKPQRLYLLVATPGKYAEAAVVEFK